MGNVTPAQDSAPTNIGRYTVLGELASGGMATVHLGRMAGPAGFSLTVAIKRLHAEIASQPEFTEMLCDEARLAGRVRHPNVVPIIDVVEEDGTLSLVMEYVRGECVDGLLRLAMKRQPRGAPPAVAVAIALGMLEGLHAAHEARGDRGEPLGIVHRDVSPQNVMVGVDGVPRVLDFGIAKAAGRLHETLNGTIKGKTPYMSPEQARSRELDRRTDVYATGVVLWEALVGRRLFTGANHVAILMKVFDEQPVAPSVHVPGLPPALDAVVLRALAKLPEDRFATAKEFAVALEAALTPASPRVVSEWVIELAGPKIAERAAIEGIAAPLAPAAIAVEPVVPSDDLAARLTTETMTHAPTMVTGAVPMHRFGGTRAWLVAATLLLGTVVVVLAFRRASVASAEARSAAAAKSAAGTTTAATTNRNIPPPSLIASAAPAPESAEPAAPGVAGAAAPTPALVTRRRAGARASGANAKAGCNPPYRIDDQGIFVPKPECL